MKRFKLRPGFKLFLVFIFIIVLIISFNKKDKKYLSKINDYINSKDNIVDKIEFDNYYEVVSLDDDIFSSIMFDKNNEEIIDIKSIISDEEKFNEKINYLLDLKYPKFISSVLKINDGNNTYYFKNNELIIYYYDYKIEPAVNEELFLRVNYNEIKDYLKINVKLDKNYENENGLDINLDKKIIAITFDDGPSKYTPEFIEELNNNKAKATFFILGNKINNYKKTIKLLNDSNMEIGYHSYAHKYFKKQKLEDIKEELNYSNNALYNIIEKKFSFVRPPYGDINDSVKSVLNMPLIFWNLDTEDWKYKDADYLTNYVLENVKDGDIILFHDIHKTTLEAIKKLLPLLYTKGYCIVTVSELASLFNHEMKNNEIYRFFTR